MDHAAKLIFSENSLATERTQGGGPDREAAAQVDPRLAFLARASARWYLVEHGDMDLEEAFNGLMSALCCAGEHEALR
jgi:hypothetical protein